MLSADYIVGLTDGEGSFTVYLRPPGGSRGGKNYKIECHYYVKLREEDFGLLLKVKKFFGCGNVYFQRDPRINHTDCYRYEVSNFQKISEVIIPFFRSHQLESGIRMKDFKLFCKIVDMVKRKKHLTKDGLIKIEKLKSQMHK